MPRQRLLSCSGDGTSILYDLSRASVGSIDKGDSAMVSRFGSLAISSADSSNKDLYSCDQPRTHHVD